MSAAGGDSSSTPASGSPTRMEAARTPLAAAPAARRPWVKKFVGPLVALVAVGGVAVGLLLLLNDKGSFSLSPEKSLGGGGKQVCGVYQDPKDPTVALTDAEVWAAEGTLSLYVFVCNGILGVWGLGIFGCV